MKEMSLWLKIVSAIFFIGSLIGIIGYAPLHPLDANLVFFALWLIAVIYYYKVKGPFG